MARSKFPSDEVDRIMLRLPDGMRDRIAAAAKANNRSMNAEIVAVLEEKFPAPHPPPTQQQVIEILALFVDMIYGKSRPEESQELISRMKREIGPDDSMATAKEKLVAIQKEVAAKHRKMAEG